MASFQLLLSPKKDKVTGKSELLIRFSHGRNIDLRAKSRIYLLPEYWDTANQKIIIPKFRLLTATQKELLDDLTIQNERLDALMMQVSKEFLEADVNIVSKNKDWLNELIDRLFAPEKYIVPDDTQEVVEERPLTDYFDEFVLKNKLSEVRQTNYKVVKRSLQRFERYINYNKRTKITLYIDTLDFHIIKQWEDYLAKEHIIAEQIPSIYKEVPVSRRPMPKGRNTIIDMLTKLRTVILWAIKMEYTTNNPFKTYHIEECLYGTPYYINIEERNRIYRTNLTRHPQLAVQRDIFVFQCLIGCRVGDLLKMTKGNLINGAIEYIPRKTKEGRPLTLRIPLNAIAQEIVERYKNCEGDNLLPFISDQKYNVAIKRIFKAAGLKRMVTVINPTTREEEKRVLYEIASSHLARRTFVGNLYKQVKDPNLVGSLSGHKEGSRAFARYREIDEQMKRELVDLLG